MTEPQSSSESNKDAASDRTESVRGNPPPADEHVPMEVWVRTLDEVRRLSEELAAARERAARAEAEASLLREALGRRSQSSPTPATSPMEGEASAVDTGEDPSNPFADVEVDQPGQDALRKAIADQLRAYTEQRSQERRRRWRRG